MATYPAAGAPDRSLVTFVFLQMKDCDYIKMRVKARNRPMTINDLVTRIEKSGLMGRLDGDQKGIIESIKHGANVSVDYHVINDSTLIDTSISHDGEVPIHVEDKVKLRCNGCGECCANGCGSAYGTPKAEGSWPGRGPGPGKYGCANLYFDIEAGLYRCASHGKKSWTCAFHHCSRMKEGSKYVSEFSTRPYYWVCINCGRYPSHCTACTGLIKWAEWFVAFARENPLAPDHVAIAVKLRAMLAKSAKHEDPYLSDPGRRQAIDNAIAGIIEKETRASIPGS
jgi:hypothetical protein